MLVGLIALEARLRTWFHRYVGIYHHSITGRIDAIVAIGTDLGQLEDTANRLETRQSLISRLEAKLD